MSVLFAMVSRPRRHAPLKTMFLSGPKNTLAAWMGTRGPGVPPRKASHDGGGKFFHDKNPPTPCLWKVIWQAPASTQKTKRKTRPTIRRSAQWRAKGGGGLTLGSCGMWVFPVRCAKFYSAVSDDVTRRESGRHLFFLSSFSLTIVATLPGSSAPGVSTTLHFGGQLAAV